MSQDLTLLRKFESHNIKQGVIGFDICQFSDVEVLSNVDSNENVALRWVRGDEVDVCRLDQLLEWLRQKPLVWIENKPVYVGDILYYNDHGAKMKVRITGPNPFDIKNNICGVILESSDPALPVGSETWAPVERWKWNPPKTKRSGWINVYQTCLGNTTCCSNIHRFKKDADADASAVHRIRVDCIEVHWEE